MFHVIAAKDFEQAAVMIEENIAGMFMRSEVPILLGWIEKLPEEILHNRPWIDIYRANTWALASQLDEVDPLLDGVENRIDPGTAQSAALLGHIAAIRAYAANLRGDVKGVIRMAQRARYNLPETHTIAHWMAAYALADACMAKDDMEGASQELQDMLRVGQHTGQLILSVPALCDLAAVRKVQGRLNQAEELYARAHHLMVAHKGLDSRVRCSYEFGLADLFRERNQLDQAYEHAIVAIELRQRLGGFLVVGDLVLMRILQARGDLEGAMEALNNAEKYMQTYPFQMAVTLEFKTERVAQCLAAGDVQTASQWADACDGGSELEQIVLARLQLVQGKSADALRRLDLQRHHARMGGRKGRLIEILGLLAIAQSAQGQPNQAEAAFSQALALARPEGFKRVFLDMGPPLYSLLEQLIPPDIPARSTSLTDAYVHDLRNAFHLQNQAAGASTRAHGLFNHLTDREKDILRLLAEGLTNKQIANQLVVAPSTIKQHLKNIYRKLEVHSRTQAVARGRELNIL